MKLNYLKLLFMAAVLVFSACNKKNSIPEPEPTDPVNPDPGKPIVNVVMKDAAISGVVKDREGNLLAGVDVATGTANAKTNSAGLFTIDKAGTVEGRSVIRFSKSGYFTVTRSHEFADETTMEVIMQAQGASDISLSTNFNASESKTLSVAGMKVDIPASSLVKKDGTQHSGDVKADMLYLDPTKDEFSSMMPGGDLAAVRADNSSVMLVSWGMAEVTLTDAGGNTLQLKNGAESEMTYPIPAGMENNPPKTIPLWWFNEETGLWEEEGVAELKGNVYVGKVKHFSWHNLDVPEDRVTVKGKVTDCKGNPISGVKVTVTQTYDYTNSSGDYSVYVPANTPVTVTVRSEDYYRYKPESSYPVSGTSGGSVVTQDVSLPCLPEIKGKITNTCSDLAGAYVWLEYVADGTTYTSTPEWAKLDGSYVLRIPPGAQSPVTLWVETIEGEKTSMKINHSGQDVTVSGPEICSKLEDGLFTITPVGGSPISIPVRPDEGMLFISEGTLSYSSLGDVLINVSINNYVSGVNEYRNVTATFMNDEMLFQSEILDAIVEEKPDEVYKITLNGKGLMYDMTTYEETEAAVSGSVEVKIFGNSGVLENVTDWSELNLPAYIPQLLLPVDRAYSVNMLGMKIVSLEYYNKTLSDYQQIKTILTQAGHTVFVEDEEGDDKYCMYMNDEAWITVEYSEGTLNVAIMLTDGAAVQTKSTVAGNDFSKKTRLSKTVSLMKQIRSSRP